MKKKNIFTVVIAAVLVVSLAVVFTACDNEPEKPEVPETTEVSTTEKEIPVIEEDTTEEETVKETEKETEKVTEKETEKVTQKPVSNSGSGNKTETPKKDTPKKDNTKKDNTETTKKNPDGTWVDSNGSTFNDDVPLDPGAPVMKPEDAEEFKKQTEEECKKNGWNTDWTLAG